MRYLTFQKCCFLLAGLMLTGSATAFEVRQVPTEGGVVHRAVIDGDWVAWGELGIVDDRGSLYLRQISTGTTTQIGIDPNPAYGPRTQLNAWAPWHPAIALHDGYLVWSDSRRTAFQQATAHIRSYELATGTERIISSIEPADGSQHQFPAIDQGQVVWQTWDYQGGMAIMTAPADGSASWEAFEAFGYSPWPIAGIGHSEGGDWVAWKDDSDRGVYARRAGDAVATVVQSPDPMLSPRAPVTNGRYVVWSVRDEGGPVNVSRIMGYDLMTDSGFVILGDIGSPEHKSNVAISDRYVVWEDWRENPTGVIDRIDLDVWAYDLQTGASFPVATGAGVQHEPWVEGDRVIWINEASGTRQIEWTTIPEPAGVVMLLFGAAGVTRRGGNGRGRVRS